MNLDDIKKLVIRREFSALEFRNEIAKISPLPDIEIFHTSIPDIILQNSYYSAQHFNSKFNFLNAWVA